jgi:hypothetical protein
MATILFKGLCFDFHPCVHAPQLKALKECEKDFVNIIPNI